MRLIADGVVDRDGVPGLAARLGYTERHLHRMLRAELGAGPLALARAQRAQTARILIETTDLGPGRDRVRGRVRQRAAVQRHDPRGVRRRAVRAARRPRGRRQAPAGAGTITLRLAYRAPLHAGALLEFLAARALPGVEEVRDGDVPPGAAAAARPGRRSR